MFMRNNLFIKGSLQTTILTDGVRKHRQTTEQHIQANEGLKVNSGNDYREKAQATYTTLCLRVVQNITRVISCHFNRWIVYFSKLLIFCKKTIPLSKL